MQLISKFNKGFRFLLYVFDIYSKYAQVIPFPLKDKKGITIINAFQKILEKPNHKPDERGEFYNRSMKSWLEKSDIEMYSKHNKVKPTVAERFIRTLRTKICKYMASVLKKFYIDKLDDIVNEYNNRHLRTIK